MKLSTIGYLLVGIFAFLPTAIMLLIIAGADLIMRGLIIAVAKTVKYWRVTLKPRKTPS